MGLLYFIFMVLVIYGKWANALLNELACEGDIHEFKDYIRLISDSDTDTDCTATCSVPSKLQHLNQKKNYVIQMGIRMSDSVFHDKTENDYMKIDLGPVTVKLMKTKIEVEYKDTKKECNVNIFENEQNKKFKPQNVFYLRADFQKQQMSVLYAEKFDKKWTLCSRSGIPSISPRKIDIEAYSEFGINLDIVYMDIDPLKSPWANQDNLEKIHSTDHKIDHSEQMDKLYRNMTTKELGKLKSSVRWLWYVQGVITLAFVGSAVKYKIDNRKKFHLL